MGKRKANTNNDERATFDDFFNDVKNGLSSEDLGNSVDGWVENFNNAILGDSDDEEDEEDGTEMELDFDDLEDDEDETDFEDEEFDDDGTEMELDFDDLEDDEDETDFEDEEFDDDETDFEDGELDDDEDELDEDDCCKCGCGHCNCCDDDEDDEELEDYDYLDMYLNVLECLRDNGIPVEQAIEYLKDSDLCYEAALDSVQMLMNKLEPVDIIKIAMRGLV